MLALSVWRIGKVAVIQCDGRIVRSDAAFRLRDVVVWQNGSRVVLLNFSGVQALDGGGLGMLIFLQVWTRERNIQLKVFDPTPGARRSWNGRAQPPLQLRSQRWVKCYHF
jgi:anti-anti-sigma regulatory factor